MFGNLTQLEIKRIDLFEIMSYSGTINKFNFKYLRFIT